MKQDMKIEYIQATNRYDSVAKVRKEGKLRVAAYARVSTADEEQAKSFDSMVQYYTDMIKNNSEWEFAGVYADKATTGTKVDGRENFQRLINDCLDGKIDKVLAKSLSRFARNTLDTLKYVRMLKERNIAVFFETENIDSLRDGEFLLTILSSVAQQEVENTSAYVKKGLKMKMKRGELVGFQGCLGYDYDPETKSITINVEGAQVVRYIFDRYVAGAGCTVIARELNEQGITTIKGNPWGSSSVMGIITNEKYKGDVLLGKTFTLDPISKRRLDNYGEEDRYYIKNHHEPIVSEEVFEKAQAMRNRRNGSRNTVTVGKREKFSRQYAFSCMLECGYCGSSLSRRGWHCSTKYQKVIWQCVANTKKGKRFCPDSKGIPEYIIEQAFIESYKMLSRENNEVLNEFLNRVEKSIKDDSAKNQLQKLNRQECEVVSKRKKLLNGYLDGTVEKEVYEATDHDLEKKLSDIRKKIDLCEGQIEKETDLKERIQVFKNTLSANQEIEQFDREVFESIVEKVIVGGYDDEGNKDPYRITFIYKTGFKNGVNNSKMKYGKRMNGKDGSNLCTNEANEMMDLCSNDSIDACGDGSAFVQTFRSKASHRG